MKKILLLAAVFSFLHANAEVNSTVLHGKRADKIAKNSEVVRLKNFTNVPNFVKFRNGKELPFVKLETWLSQYYTSDSKFGIKLLKKETGKLGIDHYRFQQTVNNVPVELSMYLAHVNNGLVQSINGEIFFEFRTSPGKLSSSSGKILDSSIT